MSRRPLLAMLAAALAFTLQPTAAGRAGLDDSANPTCPIVQGVPSTSVIGHVDVNGSLKCWRPGGSSGVKFGNNIAPASVQPQLPDPSLGDPCRNINYHPVTFTNDTAGNAAAQFSFAGGGAPGSFPEGSPYFTADDAEKMATYDAYVTDVQLGTYEPSNAADPKSPLTCQLNTTFQFFCPETGQIDQFCFTWKLDGQLGPGSPPRSLPPFFAQVLGTIGGGAGEIRSAPSQKGVVNTPTCFWIEGMGIPENQEKKMTLVLAGPPDAAGRQIFYSLLATIRFVGVDWDFDDPYGNQPDVSDPPPAPCANQPQLVMHRYPQISDGRHPDNQYHVSAVEKYSITVEAFWVGSDGAFGPVPVDPGVADPTLRPGPASFYPQFVGQVEGIPVGSP